MSRYFFYMLILSLLLFGTNLLQAQIPVSGVVSGTWSQGNTYEVVGDLYVLSGTTLTIEPDVVVRFVGYYRFYVYGRLSANGTANNPIYFTCNLIQNPNKWGGIRFSNADSLSSMSYCVIKNGWAKSPEPGGGGIYCSNSSPTLSNCTFSNNQADDDGGGMAIYNNSSPKINYCTIRKNSANDQGGGITIGSNASPTFNNCIIDSNTATSSGGGLGAWASSFRFRKCEFKANYASWDDGGGVSTYSCSVVLDSCAVTSNLLSGGYGDDGAGINAENSTLTLIDCFVSSNHNASSGGGIMVYQSLINISNSVISNNSALDGGGGIYLYGTCQGNQITNSKISYNSAPNNGGGILLNQSCIGMENCEFSYNTAKRGGGMHLNRYWASIRNCSFMNNSAPSQIDGDGGGGIYVTAHWSSTWNSSGMDITDCLFKDNSGARGGGIYGYSWDSRSTIKNCTFENNSSSPWGGGGIFNSGASVDISHCLFRSNRSTGYGGGITNSYASPTISHCVFYNNRSSSYGGGISNADGGSPIIERCTMYGDSASFGGGIAISNCNPIINSTIIDSSIGIGIYFGAGSSNTVVKYSDFFNNVPINLGGSDVPPGLGAITATNYNGDPCDDFKNIFLDPLFVGAANRDFQLQSGSPCINAGDPALGLDTLGTYVEIGRYDYPPLSGIEPFGVDIPNTYYLSQNYPNPFNPSTTIRFELPKKSHVTLRVYDMLGREVLNLVDEHKGSGTHEVRVEASMLPSGVYFYRLLADKFVSTKRFILVR